MIKSGTSKRKQNQVIKEEKHEQLSRKQRLNNVKSTETYKEMYYEEVDNSFGFFNNTDDEC